MAGKIDSNIVSGRIAKEIVGQVGTLVASPIWYPLAPNSYGEFGSTVKTVARNPISAGRQRLKGNVVDLDAVGAFQVDFTSGFMRELLPGFLFADWRDKPAPFPTAVTAAAYTVGAAASNFATGQLVFASGFAIPGNNGLKAVTGTTGTSVQVAGLTAEASPPAGAVLTKVGIQAGAGDITVTVGGGSAQLNSTVFDFTTLGLIPGEWLYIGGDASITRFATPQNNGFARVRSITATQIVLDRQPTVEVLNGTPGMIADAGAGQTIQLFIAHAIKNEADPALIKTQSYQIERQFASNVFEYLIGAVPNTLEIQVSSAQKITVEVGFIAIDSEDTLTVAKAGARPPLLSEVAYNATSDFSRLRTAEENVAATLYTYLTETRLTINNNVEAAKSVAKLGAFDVNLGDFAVAGTTKAYFVKSEAVVAVRNNADVSTDFAIVTKNVGWLFDQPLLTLGNGRRTVEKDKAVYIDLTSDAAAHPIYNHTLLVNYFPYLPNVAQ